MELVLQNPNRYSEVGIRSLRPWLRDLLDSLVPEADSFVVRFVSDREMRRLNRSYRELDRSTDVLSFGGGESPEGHHLGDVVIAIPTARRQAEEAGREVAVELRTLILHGVLHCMGYDHETDSGEMGRIENRLRKEWVANSD